MVRELWDLVDRAEKLDPNLAELDQTRASIHRELGERQQAEQWARRSIEHRQELPLAYWVLSTVVKADDEGIRMLERGLTVATKPVDVWLLNMELSRTYGWKHPELQLEASQRALKAMPGTWWPLNNTVMALVKLERYQEAAEAAREALQLKDYAWTRAYLAAALLGLGRVKEMDEEATAINDAPALAWVAERLAINYGQHEHALRLAERAIQINPDETSPRLQRANALFQLGRTEEATAEYERVIRLEPRTQFNRQDQGSCYHGLAIVAYRKGHYSEAKAFCQKALALYPGQWGAQVLLGTIQADVEHDCAAAIPNLEAIIVHRPRDTDVNYYLGLCYRETGRDEEGTALWKRLIEWYPRSEWADRVRKQLELAHSTESDHVDSMKNE